MARLGLNASGFQVGMKQAEGSVHKLNHAMTHQFKDKLTEYFGIAALGFAVEKTIEYGKHIEDTSARLDVSTKALQEWNFAATQSGASLENVTSFFEKLGMARDEALGDGDGKMAQAFIKLGVSIDDLKSKRLEDIGKQIGNTFKAGDAQKLIGSLREVGGRGAGALVAAFKDGLDESAEAGNRLGIILEDGVIEKLDRMAKKSELFAAQWRGPIADVLLFAQEHLMQIADFLNVIGQGPVNFIAGKIQGLSNKDAAALAREATDSALQAVMDRTKAEEKAAETRKHEEEERGHSGGGSGSGEAASAKAERKEIERIAEIRHKNNLDALKPYARLSALLREQSEYQKLIGPHTTDEEKQQAEREGQIGHLQREVNSIKVQKADSIAQVGGFIGNASANNPGLDLARQQLQVQKKIESNTAAQKTLTAQF